MRAQTGSRRNEDRRETRAKKEHGDCRRQAAGLSQQEAGTVVHGREERRLSPKCHPEVAWNRIECSRGLPKQEFWREINEVSKNLHANIPKSISFNLSIGEACEMCRAYQTGVDLPNGKSGIGDMGRRHMACRNILDMDSAFIDMG